MPGLGGKRVVGTCCVGPALVLGLNWSVHHLTYRIVSSSPGAVEAVGRSEISARARPLGAVDEFGEFLGWGAEAQRCRGRSFSLLAISSSSAWVTPARLLPFGKYWRRRPYIRRLPRCRLATPDSHSCDVSFK